ncbi:isoleucine--tRNA ligase [Candidatus Woesearchaeota archaeon]|nr:isoleucine--tRNA ligase [Candidatus Woesearchaeota archaeon]
MKSYDAQKVEETTLKFWEKREVYKKVKTKNKGKKNYYFLDGPPYTSGKVHIGTAWNKSLKDAILRYKRMKGLDVWDRAGYDMHGLPTAHKIQAKNKLKDKEDIQKFGVAKFIKECKKFSTDNMKVMNKDFARLGVWMDFENAYQTIENSFIEGCWWLVKKAHEKKRLYEGKKTMHWCAECATALAKHELEYKEVEDTSIFVKLQVVGAEKEFLIIWTTTPWTIPYNLAIMANPKFEYIKAKVGDETWILAKDLANILISSVANKKFQTIETFKGKKLEGLKYNHPFEKDIQPFKDISSDKLHTVVMSDQYVDLSAGSGLVHCAPGCGPEDYEVGHKNKLPAFNNLDHKGQFPDTMGQFSGLFAKKDDQKFISALEKQGALIGSNEVEHDYAHCWRCKSPVIFRTTKQWFFKIEDLKENMRELNKNINWVPDWAGNKQFDSWLDNLRDNSITRQRFWGTPVPIWKCSECNNYTVIGSIDELKKQVGKIPDDLHIPWIDNITMKCKCGGIKKRIPDILDVWIDAGTTSWTCLDYPQKRDLFKKLWPAEFILEGKDQIRGWFNLLFVASMIGMEKPSYKSVYMHGFVQDAQGRKMSKSLGNYILPQEVIDKYGADTLRYYLIGAANPGLDVNYNFDDMKLKHKNLGVLWNVQNYLIQLSRELKKNPKNLDEVLIKNTLSVEERYILSKLNSTIKKTSQFFEKYELNEVPLVIEELFLDLSRTYIQLTREKIIKSKEEKEVVMHTLYKCLLGILKLFAPIAPFISEEIYQNLRDEFTLKEESVHLFDWPEYNAKSIDKKLEENVMIIGNIIQSGLAVREKLNLGVRWPIKEAIIVSKEKEILKAVELLGDILKTQLNVKEIKVEPEMPLVKRKIKANYAKLAPVFKDKTPIIVSKLALQSAETILGHLEGGDKYVLKVGKDKFELRKEHIIVERDVPQPFVEGEFRKGLIYLNGERNDELEAEGYAREIMRRVQSLRKTAGLRKQDNISLFVKINSDLVEMLNGWEEQIKEKVGAEHIKISELNPGRKHKHYSKEKVKGEEFELFFDCI